MTGNLQEENKKENKKTEIKKQGPKGKKKIDLDKFLERAENSRYNLFN